MNRDRLSRFLSFFLIGSILIAALSGCGRTKVVLTTGFSKDQVFIIGDASCYLPEVMVYLTDVQYQYDYVYGSGIWNASLDGVTLESNVKDTVLAKIAQVKTMVLLAKSKGISLDEDEKEIAKSCAREYFSKLSQAQIEYLQITEEQLTLMYEEYALSEKVVSELIADINPEISDDEARTVVAEHIFFKTSITDGAGNVANYSSEEKTRLFEKAQEARERAIEGEDFTALAAEYSDESQVEISFGRGVMPENVEIAVFSLAKDEVSEIITTETGFHIFKCISTLDRVQTDENKLVMVEERKQQVFEEEYDSFVKGLVRNLNNELWDNIELSRENLIEVGFFSTYSKYFEDVK